MRAVSRSLLAERGTGRQVLYLSPIKAPCTGSPAAPLGLAGRPRRPAHGQPPFPIRQSGPPPTHSCPVREPSRRRRALPPATRLAVVGVPRTLRRTAARPARRNR